MKVCDKKCDQCLFSEDKVVNDARRKEILETCAANDSHFVCHKFEAAKAFGKYDGDTDVCCRAFYDRNPQATNLMRIAFRLGMIQFVGVPEIGDEDGDS